MAADLLEQRSECRTVSGVVFGAIHNKLKQLIAVRVETMGMQLRHSVVGVFIVEIRVSLCKLHEAPNDVSYPPDILQVAISKQCNYNVLVTHSFGIQWQREIVAVVDT